ncbi:50S ribosomal protein L9 [Candidatus Kaiserbacteria bacterium]|nr:50S ribosomal protein L9 [Candidatus Kaiserbacteria bacterium]NCT01759.1 50S ribosomal protein L9 [Candidatus Parcubacteria bacterium]
MKVILLQDVAKIGRRFSVTEVPDGYALNQLIPKKLAEPATPINLKRIERRQASIVASKEASESLFEAAVKALDEKGIIISVEANEQGHLFKAIREADIVAAASTAGVIIDQNILQILTPIKAVGEHEVQLTGGKKNHLFTVTVVKK